MSYGATAALQEAVFQKLTSDAALGAFVGTAIYDAIPGGALPAIYVALGSEVVRDRSDKTAGGAAHDLTVSVITEHQGFHEAKLAAGAISDALVGADLSLSRGRLVGLWFLRAKAKRVTSDGTRRIDMIFRARVEDD